MGRTLQPFLLLLTSTLTLATNPEPDLPLCPTSFQYFPQNLPMHCRMPPGANNNFPNLPHLPISPTFPPAFYQSPEPDKQPQPIPFPVPPSFPGPTFPGPVPLPPPGMPVPMPIGMAGPSHKLPVIVMPFYSPDPSYKKHVSDYNNKERKKRRKIHVNKRRRKSHKYRTTSESSSDTDNTDTDASSDTDFDADSEWWDGGNTRRSNGRRKRKNRTNRNKEPADLLTPVIQYVTKDGYVIYEKEISKNEARDWMNMKKEERDDNKVPYTELDDLTDKDVEEVNVEKVKDIRPKEVKYPPMRSPLKKRRRYKNVNEPQQPSDE